ncbi:MAG: CopG family transcriptional regulator, partial [Methylacidiphilales bacterium]|nr:CopG family transcriptional regulator [Candidatus Methylacidiphilales bacterium]
MARKTKTAVHGQKKKDVTVTLTPEGVEILDARAEALGISRSELIERMARSQKFIHG